MRISVAVTTAPRPVPTLHRALRSMREAGFWGFVRVHCDGPTCDPRDSDVGVWINDPPLKLLGNWMNALRTAHDEDASDFILIAQDDTRWARGTRVQLERDIWQLGSRALRAGYLSLHTDPKIERELRNRMRAAVNPGPLRGWYASRLGFAAVGAQAYLIPRNAAGIILQDEGMREFMTRKDRNLDNILSARLLDLGLETLYRVPCFVSHEFGSGNSSLRDKPRRDTHCWEEVAS